SSLNQKNPPALRAAPLYTRGELRLFRQLTILGGILSLFLLPTVTCAQITLDGSLGPKGPLAGPDYSIDAKVGQLRGNNLFHSFGHLNIHNSGIVFFCDTSAKVTVRLRVTRNPMSVNYAQVR